VAPNTTNACSSSSVCNIATLHSGIYRACTLLMLNVTMAVALHRTMSKAMSGRSYTYRVGCHAEHAYTITGVLLYIHMLYKVQHVP
jgi:hypothetical protein